MTGTLDLRQVMIAAAIELLAVFLWALPRVLKFAIRAMTD